VPQPTAPPREVKIQILKWLKIKINYGMCVIVVGQCVTAGEPLLHLSSYSGTCPCVSLRVPASPVIVLCHHRRMCTCLKMAEKGPKHVAGLPHGCAIYYVIVL
jgi:hypothetical protein